jgi:hypothetical protein
MADIHIDPLRNSSPIHQSGHSQMDISELERRSSISYQDQWCRVHTLRNHCSWRGMEEKGIGIRSIPGEWRRKGYAGASGFSDESA